MTANQPTGRHLECDIPNNTVQDQRSYGSAIYQLSAFLNSVSATQVDDAMLACRQSRLLDGVDLVSVYLRIHPEFAPFRDALVALTRHSYHLDEAKWTAVCREIP